jgi:hypothetical protein
MNAEWHAKHVMPKGASVSQRIAWHRAHQAKCACRPIPPKLLAQMQRAAETPPTDPRFARVVAAFAKAPDVTYGGKGFGSAALKVDGKIFAMLSSRGQFVVKLPKRRVDELVRMGQGTPFDAGRGRAMKEWLTFEGKPASWIALAQEARRFVQQT